MIAAVCADLLVGAPWLTKDKPAAVTSVVFLLFAMNEAFGELLFEIGMAMKDTHGEDFLIMLQVSAGPQPSPPGPSVLRRNHRAKTQSRAAERHACFD